MRHSATVEFWQEYRKLPAEIQSLADKQFAFLKSNDHHPSVQFKKIGERHGHEVWSARVSRSYRAVAIRRGSGFLWFWIGDHRTYESLIS